MAITSTTTTQTFGATIVTVVSDLSGTVMYHWYLDGAFVSATNNPSKTFFIEQGDQVRVEVIDTLDPDFDSVANAPVGYPARRSLWWVRSTSLDVAKYRIEQQRETEGFVVVNEVTHVPGAWSFSILTVRLDDLTNYDWRIIPIDGSGNEGTPLAFGPQKVVRRPDSPGFEIAFDSGTTKVTFNAAA